MPAVRNASPKGTKGANMKKRSLKAITDLLLVVFYLGMAVNAAFGETTAVDKTKGYYPKEALLKVEYKGQAMSVNTVDGFMIVRQVKVHVVNGLTLKDGTAYTTVLLDENGNALNLAAFKNYQRVWVTGYRARDGYMFAEKIQRQRNKPKDKLGPSPIPQ